MVFFRVLKASLALSFPLIMMVACGATSTWAVFRAPAARAADQNPEMRDRLNKIFYWQVADELKLSAQDEKKMVSIIEDIQKRREESLKKRDEALEDLRKNEKTLSNKVAEPLLKNYQDALEELAKMDVDESKRLKEVLGAENLARFYLLRDTLAKRVREALKNATADKAGDKAAEKTTEKSTEKSADKPAAAAK